MNHDDVQVIRDDIVRAALPHVVYDGWSWDTILRGAAGADYSEHEARAVFSSGVIDALEHFSDLADREMLAALERVDPEDLRVRDRVRMALAARFEWLMSCREAALAAIAFWSVPSRKPRAMKTAWRTADVIWRWAGDVSTDYNHYTKRGLLLGILVSATLVWVDDKDPDIRATKDFIERRIGNVMRLGEFISGFKRRFGQDKDKADKKGERRAL